MSADEVDPDELGESVERPMVRLFTEYGGDHLHWFAIGLATSMAARFLSLVPPLVLGVALDAVFYSKRAYTLPLLPDAWIPTTRMDQFWFSAEIMGVSMVLAAVCNFARSSSLNLFSHRVKHEVRTATYQWMQRLDMTFFDDHKTGELMSILNNDANRLELFLDNMMGSAIQLLVLIIGIGYLLFTINPQLALVTLSIIPVAALFTWWFMKRVEAFYADVRSSVGDLNTRLENNLGGIEVIKTSGTESFEDERVRSASYEYFKRDWQALRMNFVYRPGMQLLTSVAFAATFVVGGLWFLTDPPLGFSGTLYVGQLVTFLLFTQRMVEPLTQMSEVVDRYEDAKASTKRIFGLLSISPDITSSPGAVELDSIRGRVEYDHVDFAYEDGQEVLSDVTFTADPGETVGLVGPTGAGKSTICKLLPRLYDVTGGEIRVDGHDVRDVTVESLREHIGYVGQDTFLFDGTVRENIAYGAFDATDDEIEAAAKAAEAHEFVTNLPDGYDTRVGERGVKLSGGQRQRISIARTILADPELLVLDEATSAVDTETEMLIQRSLDRLTEDRTTFIIAHRLSTVKGADTILSIEDGRIVERGTHERLLDGDGLYADLWRVQAGEIDALSDEFVAEATRRASASRTSQGSNQ
ncbi:ABC transporter related protein [Haladaptatus paucihalophilus DX253]|uniref:ABC transporter related protein n=1 Tax=Haladaptatus paucihalophilus DX253 TaxID=797209 RepID=E7QS15_HALPU|nr:ABC transporter ATP-binding protein [Haladaptatus paucihalophilus]EFW92784.1 ABC transporter related protein [Haladaptatus paucihalophilus DX253]SHK12693.1 ATP-binding cassette, subfamily B [Haladaptatus paucihalophilus DX253]